jgi:hypothetical protein
MGPNGSGVPEEGVRQPRPTRGVGAAEAHLRHSCFHSVGVQRVSPAQWIAHPLRTPTAASHYATRGAASWALGELLERASRASDRT